MNNLSFVCLKEEYLESLVSLEEACFDHGWSRKAFQADIKRNDAHYSLAINSGSVVGYCGLYWVLDQADITNIAVHPAYRRQGIASKLLENIFEFCRLNNIYTINLEVRKSNTNAIALYNKHGFEIVGQRKNYYPDNREDAILMTKQRK